MKKCSQIDKLSFEKKEQKTKRGNKKKINIIWYNLPFSSSLKTNIGK